MPHPLSTVCMEALKREVIPALGCTEPIAVALATALSARELTGKPDRIEILVSANLYKNGLGVMVPGTGCAGLDIAAAAGALAGDPELELQVLRDITPDQAKEARELLAQGRVSVGVAPTEETVYAEATVHADGEWARTVIEGAHTRVVRREKNGTLLFELSPAKDSGCPDNEQEWPLSLAAIWEFADDPPPEAVEFIVRVAEMNSAAGDEGLKGEYGLQVGKSLSPEPNDIIGDDTISYAVRLTAAGSDLRMGGAMMPVYSNSGSGNQGIACTLPIVAFARRLGVSQEEMAKALLLSHLVNIHIKHYVGRLSALCGAITASTGASCGLVRMMGGDLAAIGRAIRNMTGDLAGMICDGAKYTCALKVATTTAAAAKAARLALRNHAPGSDNGIVDDDPEASIRHLAVLASKGMYETDKVILEIMVAKKEAHDAQNT